MPSNGEHGANTLRRRRLLRGLGTVGLVGAAGCISSDGDIDPDGKVEKLIYEGFQEADVEPPIDVAITVNQNNPDRVQWAELLANDLEGTDMFDVTIDEREWATYVDYINGLAEDDDENPLVCLGIGAGWDPHGYVNTTYHSDYHAPQGLNVYHYENETVDELIEAGRAESDKEARIEIYEEIQEILVKEAPLAYVQYDEQVAAWDSDAVSGFETYPLAGEEFKGIYAPHTGVYTELTNGEDELVADTASDVPNTDPVLMDDTTSNYATDLIFERLLNFDFDGTPQPQLATDWEQLDDTTWRFDLREGVTFHNGDEFTADDVLHTFERHEGQLREADVYDWYEDMEIVGDHEIEIELQNAYMPFEAAVADVYIVPEAAGDPGDDAADVDLSDEPIGTGPYQFDEHQEGNRWRMTRFDDHWYTGDEYDNDVPETPPIETVTLEVIEEGSSRHNALETGDIHLCVALPSASVAEFEDDDGFEVDRRVGASYEFVMFPLSEEPFDNEKVRRGISSLIRRDVIIEDVYDDVGEAAVTPITPMLEEYASEEFRQRMEDEYLI